MKPFVSAFLALTLAAPAGAFQTPSPAPPAAAAPSDADRALRALYEAEWAWQLEQDARTEGDGPGAYMDHLPRVDAATQAARRAHWQATLDALDRIPAARLSSEEQLNAAVLRALLEERIAEVRWRTFEAPFNSDTFFWTEIAHGAGFADADEYRRYIGRLRDVPRYFAENEANMRAGLARGYSVPQVSLAGRDRTIEPFTADDEANPLYKPFRRMPATIPAEVQAQLRTEARAAMREAAIPAYRALLTMFRDEYVPRARTSLGASELPDGREFYQSRIRTFTTLDISPSQIHALGLSEVARIHAEMEAVMRRAGFTGSFAEFIHFLRTDPQFYAKTPAELLGAASYAVMRANGQLGGAFGTIPRFRHGVIPVPDELAPIYTGGRGGLRNCMFNTYNLPQRPLYTLPALALHECTPGHSFQAALALEGPDRPKFRQEAYFSGYGEGWGLYVEWLGTVMGTYQTPYEDFGRLTYEMWRACRLVIDTGIHAEGWSRERAIAYLRDNTALSDLEITNEIDRYIAWPGQAVAYKLGELQIRRLRAEAEQRLGTRFDQRGFHDAILSLGSVPLPVMEQRVEAWIGAQERVAAAAGEESRASRP